MADLTRVIPELLERTNGMMADAAAEGLALKIACGFRPLDDQWDRWNDYQHYLKDPKHHPWAALAAYPGTSDHGKVVNGVQIDSTAVDLDCINPTPANQAAHLKLAQKWGLRRTVKGEYWHLQIDPNHKPLSSPQSAVQGDDDMSATFVVPCPTGGYWEVRRADGGVYAWAGAPSFGSMSGKAMNAPVVALGFHQTNGQVDGYWLLGEDGGVFAFGNAPYTDSYAAHSEWHNGSRYLTGIVQHGDGYDILSTEPGTDPPKQNVYDLSVKR